MMIMKIGDKLPNFKLSDTNSVSYSNYSFADRYALCVIFISNNCPISNAYWNRIFNFAHQYEEDNMALVAINSNDGSKSQADTIENMKAFMENKNAPNLFYLKDEDQTLAKEFGAEKTPEIFLFNSKRELVYHGIFDDNWQNETQVMMAYLEDAVEYCLDGIDIDYPELPIEGSPIIWK